MNTFDLGWVIGFFEGEGSIGVANGGRRKDGTSRAYPSIRAGQVDRSPLFKLQSLFGGRVGKPRYRPNIQPYSMWELRGAGDVAEFVASVGPHLTFRRQDRIMEAYWQNHLTKRVQI